MDALEISSFARLHFGLLQMSGAYRSRNMGIGAALSAPCWRLRIRRLDPHNGIRVSPRNCRAAPEVALAAGALLEDLSAYGIPRLGLQIEILEAIPSHVGLGSTTALLRGLWGACGLFATGTATGIPIQAIKRGGTSGIGVNLSEAGGIIVDTGHVWTEGAEMDTSRARAGASVPGVVVRYQHDEARFLLARVRGLVGPSGETESRIFRRTLPLEREEVNRIAGIVLFEALPALASARLPDFAKALASLQHLGFKKREWDVQSDATKELATTAYRSGADCVALSSMGPTVAIMAEDLEAVRCQLQNAFGHAILTALAPLRNDGMEWSILE